MKCLNLKFISKIFMIFIVIQSTNLQAQSKGTNSNNICNTLKNSKSPYGLIVDSVTGNAIKNIELGDINKKSNSDYITKTYRLIVSPKRLIPHQVLMADVKFIVDKPKYKCNSTTEYLATVYLPKNRFSKGKFNIDYLIDLEDPESDEPSIYVYTIRSKLTGVSF